MNIKINTSRSLSGFTLIELLVVMGVISILAGMSIFAMQGARQSARDASRRGNLESIATALEFYRADCHEYPSDAAYDAVAAGDSLTDDCDSNGTDEIYLESMPEDPLIGKYAYRRIGLDGVRYTLCSTLEDPPDPANDTTNCDLCAGGACEYRIVNP